MDSTAHRAGRLWCAMTVAGLAASVQADDLIRKVTHEQVLTLVAQRSKVIFVDAREADEHAEERLPNAIQVPLRQAAAGPLQSIPRDATVVAYCLKDFRGYEVARALQRAGYNVRVMDDPGLNGWKRDKLPTAGTVPGTTDAQALAALRSRAAR